MARRGEPGGDVPREEAIRDENRRIRALRISFDLTRAAILQDSSLTLAEALGMCRDLRRLALSLFPGKEETYEILYRPRLRRAVEERFGVRLAGQSDLYEPE